MSRWTRVNKNRRCPICEHADWCLIAPDGAAVICMRLASDKEKRLKDGGIGWIHAVGEQPQAREYIPAPAAEILLDVEKIMRRYKMDTTPHMIAELAQSLGVSDESLEMLGAAWSRRHQAWAFPMRDANRKPIGVRLRSARGEKWAIRGSRSGLFIPKSFPEWDGPVFIVEGPTDCAAMLSLQFNCIGRPSCSSGGEIIRHLIAGMKNDIVIIQDRDGPGKIGAEDLAASLRRPCKIIEPLKGKDAREWKKFGATRAIVMAVVANKRFRTRKDS